MLCCLRIKRCARTSLPFLLFVCCFFNASAQTPVIKIDLNQTGRPDAEVLEPGYTGWALPATTVDTATLALNNGVTIKLIRKGPYGDKLNTNWYKAGIQTPYFARLVCDGVRVNNGTNGAQIEMRISGLPAGNHSILTYHNNVDNLATGTFAPIDVYLDGVMKYDNLMPTVRSTVTSDVPTAYVFANAVAGQDVVMLFVADTTTGVAHKNFMLNGIEINVGNPLYQAKLPYPVHGDEHVDADNGTLNMSWTNAASAVASHVYIGIDSASVANATPASALYKGRVTSSAYTASGQYSMNSYYWRIDQEDVNGNVTKGNIWFYRPRQLAFRDAEGYGRFARGGRGGKVVHVTNLNDNGPGSLREAIINDIGPRVIVFDVSGIITLNSRLTVGQNYITIAGQTAPGKGICIRNNPFGTGAKDIVMRHLRVRVGAPITTDGMGNVGDFSIVDNCSISWTIDEAFSSRNAKNVTLQRTLISEALNVAGHQNYPAGTAHGYAATIGGYIGSFHHNLLAHCEGRNWSMGGGLDGNGYYSGKLDITNNVVYNWGGRTTDGGAFEVNFVNNYYKPGAASRKFVALTADHEGVGQGTQRYYCEGNVMPGRFNESTQSLGRNETWAAGEAVHYPSFVAAPFFPSYVNTQTAYHAYKNVLSNVGANQPVFDDHDIRIVNETLNGTYTYVGSVSGYKGLPDKVSDVGGWEAYPEIHRDVTFDTDGDGLPNWWETLKGLNVNSAANDFSDANNDADQDGFTQLDDYLDWMGGPHYFILPGTPASIDLKLLSRGYTNSPSFTTGSAVNGSVIMDPVNAGVALFSPTVDGLASFNFTVTDAEGSSMTRTVNLRVTPDAVLPVSLVNFKAKRKDASTVALIWETLQEEHNDYFEVQRTFSPGTPFTTIAKVDSKALNGTSSVKLEYETQDANDHNGVTYYRLVQKDLDGKPTVSEIRTVNGIDALPQAKVWPVPAKGKFNILLTNAEGLTVVRVYNVDGKMIGKEETIASGVIKPFTIATSGTYFIKGINKRTGEVLFINKVVIE